jgi:hypothetical protein
MPEEEVMKADGLADECRRGIASRVPWRLLGSAAFAAADFWCVPVIPARLSD